MISQQKRFINRQLFNVDPNRVGEDRNLLKPLVMIYWIRVALSIVAAAISAVAATFFDPYSINTFINGITIALLIYLISYYVLKAQFLNKVEKQSKIMTMGIFIYFISWAAFLILFYSIIVGPPNLV
jgi:hypothetical protein